MRFSRKSSEQPLVSIQTELKIPAQPLPKGGIFNKLLNFTKNLFTYFKMEITLDSWGCYEVQMKNVIKYLWGM